VEHNKKKPHHKTKQKGNAGAAVNHKQTLFDIMKPLLFILPVVFVAFSPILDNGFTNWDDPDLITENPLIRTLSLENIKTMFTSFYFGNYQPLHLLSYSVEYHFWKLNPVGYHSVSLFLFLLLTSLVYYFVFLIGKRNKATAIIATLFFALSAMRVESVAWAAERKDMLYAVFYVSAMIAYVKYVLSREGNETGPGLRYLGIAFLFFVLSVFSKVMAVSLVGALVFLDFLYARRFSLRLILEKIPFVAVSILLGLIQIKATASTSTFDTSGNFDLIDRVLIVCRNLMFFFYKMVLPLNLSAFHPYPVRTPGASWPIEFYIAPLFVLLLLAVFIWAVKTSRVIAFSIGFFVAALALVLQFVAIGPAMFNERYSLIPAIAFGFASASLISALIARYPAKKNLVFGATGFYIVFMFVLVFMRCNVWQTSLTLWDDVLSQYPRAAIALNNRGRIYGNEMGNTTKAMEDFSAAIASDPGYERAYSNRGILYCMKGEFDKAIVDFNAAIRLDGDFYEPVANRAIAYAQTNQLEKALVDFGRCVELAPGNATNYMNRGICFLQMQQPGKALADFNKGIRLAPEKGELYLRRSQAYNALGKYPEATDDAQKAISSGFRVENAYIESLKMKSKPQ
jgi:tetratricopeptide (TPR) repeat protein